MTPEQWRRRQLAQESVLLAVAGLLLAERNYRMTTSGYAAAGLASEVLEKTREDERVAVGALSSAVSVLLRQRAKAYE